MDDTTPRAPLEPTPTAVNALPAAAPASREIDFDLYCLKCGYNLRGLYGDPVDCPECGEVNPLGEADVPETKVAARLREFESALTACVWVVLCMLSMVALSLWFVASEYRAPYGIRPPPVALLTCPSALTVVALFFWVWAALRFRASCRPGRAWQRGLVRYHVVGIFSGGVIIASMLCVAYLWPVPLFLASAWYYLVQCSIAAAAIAVARLVFPARYRRFIAPIHELQREMAAYSIREEARRRVRGARRS